MKKINLENFKVSENLSVDEAINLLSKKLGLRERIIYDMLDVDPPLFTKKYETLSQSGILFRGKVTLLLKIVSCLFQNGYSPEAIIHSLKFSLLDSDGFPMLSSLQEIRKLRTKTGTDIKRISLSLEAGLQNFYSIAKRPRIEAI